MMAAFLAFLVVLASVHAQPQTFEVSLGRMDPALGYEIFGLFPSSLQVRTGDTVIFKAVGELAHVIMFPTPEVLRKAPCWNNTARTDCGNVNGIGGTECLPVDPNRPLGFRGDANPNPGVCSVPRAFASTPPPGNATSTLSYNPYYLYPYPFPFAPMPPPTLVYPGVGWVSSGQLATLPGSYASFSVTFNTTGVYTYLDAYAADLLANITVVDAGATVPSASTVATQVAAQLDALVASVPSVFAEARVNVPPPFPNSQGSYTYNIMLGYSKGPVFLMRFFPEELSLYPGDVARFFMHHTHTAPHTVLFLNNVANPPIGIPLSQSGPPPFSDFPPFLPIVAINPLAFFPQNPVGLPAAFGPPTVRTPIDNRTLYSSGFLMPVSFGPQGRPVYDMQVAYNFTGNLSYVCNLHELLGMYGKLIVVPKPVDPKTPTVYHIKQYSTDRDGVGQCTDYQYADFMSVPPNVCHKLMDVYPFSLYIKMIPDAGVLSGPNVGKCTQSTCVHMLRWEISDTLPPCFAPIPPSISTVLTFNNCIAANNYVQYIVTAGALLVPSLLAAALAVAALAL